MLSVRERVKSAERRDRIGQVGVGTQHGIHYATDHSLITGTINDISRVFRGCQEGLAVYRGVNPLVFRHAESMEARLSVPGLVQKQLSAVAVAFNLHAEILAYLAQVNYRIPAGKVSFY